MGRRLIPLVTQERFAEITCLDGNAFGVTSSCPACDDFNFPACMRRSLREALLGNQTRAENFLGYDLSVTYHEEELLWHGESRIQLRREGISALNVKPTFTKIESQAVSPYILENVSITVDSGKKVITVPKVYVDNPGNLTIRENTSGSVIQQDESALTFPKRVGDNWVIALDMGTSVETLVDVQHCKYAQITVTSYDSTDCNGGTIFAVYEGTTELIPFAKDPVVNGLETIYWFYLWSLIDPAFEDDETIDLLNGHFYKLVEEIDFTCVKDVAALPVVLEAPEACNEEFELGENEDLTMTIIKDNIIDIRISSSACCSTSNPVRIKIFYKTDPALTRVDLNNMEQAIVYLTAAELPNVACDCEVPDHSFIASAKKPYTNMHINPYNGDVYASQRYGSMHGQMVYAERISKEKRAQRLVVL